MSEHGFGKISRLLQTTEYIVISLISHDNLDVNINNAMNQYSTRHTPSILALRRSIITAAQITICHRKFHNSRIAAEKTSEKTSRNQTSSRKMFEIQSFRRHVREAETYLTIEVKENKIRWLTIVSSSFGHFDGSMLLLLVIRSYNTGVILIHNRW